VENSWTLLMPVVIPSLDIGYAYKYKNPNIAV